MSVASVATVRPADAVPPHALRRGTRGFAAVVLFLAGLIVFAVTVFVLPSSALDRELLTILIPLGIVFSIAHLAASYGVLRRRAWVVPLTLYILAIGLGLAAFGLLLAGTGVDPFVRPGLVAGVQDRIDFIGLLVWLAGSWIVAARFVVRGMAGRERRAVEVGAAAVPALSAAQARLAAHPAGA
jgi:hypothetical protein